jgi:DNA adenine methylase
VTLVAPFPWFGGKRGVAAEVWRRFGGVRNYVEPFFGSGAVLLQAPVPCQTETVNDLDGMVANFWRAIRSAPDETAEHADWPVNEIDLTARHLWLVGQRESLTARLEADTEFCDPKAAGWWVWGLCAWIGTGWCSGTGPWQVGEDGALTMGNRGQGINRQLPHLGDRGRGINRQLPHLGDRGRGIQDWFAALSERLRGVRVCCGSWERVLTPSVLERHGVAGVFLDPPYDDGEVDYAAGGRVASDVREWALERGSDRNLRIALCGYSEHDSLERAGWSRFRWKARGGYSSQDGENANAERETIWFSPGCLGGVADLPLFAGMGA